jgi:hypothetical protein
MKTSIPDPWHFGTDQDADPDQNLQWLLGCIKKYKFFIFLNVLISGSVLVTNGSGGPKTYGSYGSWCGSGSWTLMKTAVFFSFSRIRRATYILCTANLTSGILDLSAVSFRRRVMTPWCCWYRCVVNNSAVYRNNQYNLTLFLTVPNASVLFYIRK